MPAWRLMRSYFPSLPKTPIPSGDEFAAQFTVSLTKAQMCQAEWSWKRLYLSIGGTFTLNLADIGITATYPFASDGSPSFFSDDPDVDDWRGLIASPLPGTGRNFLISAFLTIPSGQPYPYNTDFQVEYSLQWAGPIFYNPPYGNAFTKSLTAGVTVSNTFDTGDPPFSLINSAFVGAPGSPSGNASLPLGLTAPYVIGMGDPRFSMTISNFAISVADTIPAPPDL